MSMDVQNLSGRSLGQYQLLALLNKGGMGAVYRAIQGSLGREVAIKVLPASLAEQEGYVERFKREARTAAALEHPHIVPVYDYGVDQGVTYVAMRLLAGGSLTERAARYRSGAMPLDEIAALIKPVASALDYAHSRGVIHRDIKPSNIMFDEQGTVYVVDFGIAKMMQSNTMLTTEGSFVGTPIYMSPEQWTGGKLTQAADQYALAVVTYQLLTGVPPFEADTPYVYMHRHVNEVPTPPRLRRADVSPSVSRVIERALAKNPADRYPSVGAFAAAFSEALRQPFDAAPPDTAPAYTPPTPSSPPAAYPAAAPYAPVHYPAPPPTPTPTPPPYYAPAPPRKANRLPLYILIMLAISCCGCASLFAIIPALDDERGGLLSNILDTPTAGAETEENLLEDTATPPLNATFTPVNTPTLAVTPTLDVLADLFAQGLAAMEIGAFARAEELFTQALALDPNNSDLYTRRADARWQQNNAAGAIQDYRQALAIRPDAVWLHAAVGWLYLSLGDYANAASSFTSAIDGGEAAGNPFDLYSARAEAFAALGLLQAAITDFLTASGYDPSSPYVFQRLGDISYEIGAFADALGYYRLYVSLAGSEAQDYATSRIAELEAQGY